MWKEFKAVLLNAVNKFIPSKMTKEKLGYPWIDSRIRALIKKKEQELSSDSITRLERRLFKVKKSF